MEPTTYNADQISCVFGSVVMQGKGKDEFCSVEKLEVDYTAEEGVDGLANFNRTNSTLCRVTIRLMATSKANKLLSEIRKADLASPNGVFEALTIRDKLGNDLHTSNAAKIETAPVGGYGKESGEREWSFLCANMSLDFGGH